MMPASNNGVGMNTGFPDVCLTPPPPPVGPYPIPYPNLALNAQAATFSPNVFTGFMPSLFMASVTPMTGGDEAGCLNPLFKQAGGSTMGNPIVFINCQPATNLLCPSWGNAMNCPLGATTVPSVTTTLYTDQAALELTTAAKAETEADACWPAAPPTVDAAGMRRLHEAVKRHPAGAATTQARSLPDGSRVVTLERFTDETDHLLYKALRGCATGSAVIIDLRDNPGGDADVALALAGQFLPRQTRLALVQEGGDEVDDAYPVRALHDPCYPQRLLLVVNRATASAAELFAAALQTHRRALVVGCRTAGKATAQRLVAGADPRRPRYATVACFRRPDGSTWHGRGLEPDVTVPDESDGLTRALEIARASDPAAGGIDSRR